MDMAMMKRLVLSYYMGHLRDPDLRDAIEHAREWDPIVRSWFTQLDSLGQPDAEEQPAEPSSNRKTYTHRVTHNLSKRPAAKPVDVAPPVLRQFPELPSQEIDLDEMVLRMTYLAQDLPYGVAWVTAEAEGKETFRRLVVFPQFGEGAEAIRQAEVRLEDLGVPLQNPPLTTAFVVFAVEENLHEFPLDLVTKLAEDCNGNYGQYIAVQSLVERLNSGVQP